jgi:bifunctional non-homologous end joining protein LigD
VEAVGDGATRWYRVIHGDNTIDWLTITDVEHRLHRAGVDMKDVHDVDPAA